ncbi:C-type lectin domain family 4 member A [Venturia canescens]|uniref:C-type lectin domain family 4 member A n=1 Tax=Venturia canescens TaxID=32260 RepID=UPI001C9CBABD|nr:C-type lectin domain family 4 member A [Venturia canescens]
MNMFPRRISVSPGTRLSLTLDLKTSLMALIVITSSVFASGIENVTLDQNFQSTRLQGPWSEILEDWITTNDGSVNSRQAKVMRLGDKGLTISYKGMAPNKRDVSETDLYLLSAIEKLVYRVDFLEKRLRRSEELLYYVISGNNNAKDACPSNYTRVGQNCYHFSYREFDWKSSASFCRGMGGNLVELETVEENQDLVTYLQATKNFKGKSYWTAGLNPGLLWIWAGSARPVHEDTKQTVIGNGRCLKLDYNSASRIYSYKGEDCGTRQRYICELTKDDELGNKIERTARAHQRSNI